MFALSAFASVVLTVVVAAAPAAESGSSTLPEASMPAADAKITPDGLVLFRFKREPQMNRAMTFTGFMPNGGMTAFSAAADSFQRPSWYSKPADTLSPPTAESDQPAMMEQEEPQWAKKPKKKPYHPSKYYPSQTTMDEDEEEYEQPSRRGGSATASFNAWFPIMFGNFPGQGGQYGRNGQDGSKPAGDSYNSPLSRASDYPGQTVIANSVSNGKGGVASSHAVAYGNGQEGRNYGQNQNGNQASGQEMAHKMANQGYY